MIANLRPAIVSMVLFTALLGLAYPLGVAGLAQALFPAQASGSLIRNAAGDVVGSRWIGQNFKDEAYLRPRPSAAGKDGYDASGSSGSNLGPMNQDLVARIKADAEALRAESKAPIPVDAVTSSGSGLDPHVSPANAARQVPRIAAARKIPAAEVQAVIAANTEGSTFGLLGEPRVNVLAVNLALDARWPRAQR
jgi:K+-transporting ATPase ATPase C chain